jgi:hypothetical protein
MALNDITVLQEQADGSLAEIVLPISFGPLTLLQNYDTGFDNSGYDPGITTTSTPADFGFYVIGLPSLTVNPFTLFGAGQYRIKATVRKTATFGDGLHVLIRRVIVGDTEIGIPNLLDWGSGLAEVATSTSDALTTTNTPEFYRVYFAAYDGGNGGTPRDVSLTLERI